MYLVHVRRVQVDGVKSLVLEKSLVAELYSLDSSHSVAVPQTPYHSANDVVESRAETSACADSSCDMSRIEVDFFPWARFLHQVRHVVSVRRVVGENIDLISYEGRVLHIGRAVIAMLA